MARHSNLVVRDRTLNLEEIRLEPSATSWQTYLESHADVLTLYDLCVREILTTNAPISLGLLIKILQVKYRVNLGLVRRFINWIS